MQDFRKECVLKKNLFLNWNACCEYSKEPFQLDGSFEHPKHVKTWGKQILTMWHYFFLSKPVYIYLILLCFIIWKKKTDLL